MPGLSDYTAQNNLNYVTGNRAPPALPSVWLGLYTAMPTSDAGTGGTEVSAGGYARVQVAGALAANGAFTTASPNITMNVSNPGWVVPGMNVYDATGAFQIGTVLTYIGTALVLTANAAHASSGSTDSLVFSAWPAASASTGTEPAVTPATVTNGAVITFPTATADWTNAGANPVIGFGLFDAVSGGNNLAFDYIGNYPWLPATMSAASPGVITAKAHGYSAADPVVVTAKYGGTIPSFSQSNLTGVLAVVSPTTDTLTVTNGGTAVNTSTTGDFSIRKLTKQSIPAGITATFAASTLTLNQA